MCQVIALVQEVNQGLPCNEDVLHFMEKMYYKKIKTHFCLTERLNLESVLNP